MRQIAHLFITVVLIITSANIKGQSDSATIGTISIGKRGNFIYDRAISESNLNSKRTYYYTIYFKVNDDSYSRIGWRGNKLKPFFSMNELSYLEFQRFRRKKLYSKMLLPVTVVSLFTWPVMANSYQVQMATCGLGTTVPNGCMYRAYLHPKALPFLLIYIASFAYSIHLNLKGDVHLSTAAFIYNKSLIKY